MAVPNDFDIPPTEVSPFVLMNGVYRRIPGNGSLNVNPEAAPVSTYPLQNGRAVKRIGAQPPPNGTIEALFAGRHPVMEFLRQNAGGRKTVTLRIQTAAEDIYRPKAASTAVSGATIAAADGKVTFSGTTTPDEGSGTTPGELAEDDILVIDNDETAGGVQIKRVIGLIDATGVYVDPSPAADVSEDLYYLATPQLQLEGRVSIKLSGGFTSSASGEVVTSNIEFEFVRDPGAWTVV